ncbi:BQ5605_C019g08902 [Microbotryum silenes-dioicae]|uniref:triacylglycerol lipase n=1 Tax=Microbotryum silenes-dioicae TaxID=796604 RepID=A0A2X0M009_9BASI|nr:BQ5605_C019g08896 [Microbotryum silenes-dioicae]SGY23128.1 BQ5605_C019g08902 [Microbotryum silenes-dioicae]
MMDLHRSTILRAATGILALCASLTSAALPAPDSDPFYVPPSTFANDAPGTVYRTRLALNPGVGVTGTQILFRTTDALGKPASTVTTILQSARASPKYLVSYNMYEDGAAAKCAPSYCFNTSPFQLFCPDGDLQLTQILLRGWTTIVTDFLGTTSAFSVGHQSGYQILDGYRAAINFLRLPKDVILGGYGYSGGAIGTGWSAALHNSYAPELNIKALAFGGTPANMATTLNKLNGGAFAVSIARNGFAVAGLAGQLSAFPELQARFDKVGTAKGKAAIASARNECGASDIIRFAFTNILSTSFQSIGKGLLSDEMVARYLALSDMKANVTETPTKPSIYMFHSKTDEVIPYSSAHETAQTWCGRGSKILFTTEIGGGGHVGTQVVYGERVFNWLDAQLRGTSPALRTCSFVNKFTLTVPVRE